MPVVSSTGRILGRLPASSCRLFSSPSVPSFSLLASTLFSVKCESCSIYSLMSTSLTLRSIQYISVERSRFKPMTYISVFLPCDIVSLVLQAVGGAMSSTSNGKSKTGVDVALAGLSFQVFTLTVFCVLVGDYFIRSRSVWRNLRLPKIFLVFTFSAALATILILVRCCYRIYELSAGYTRTSKALRDQGLFIGLESV